MATVVNESCNHKTKLRMGAGSTGELGSFYTTCGQSSAFSGALNIHVILLERQ